MPSKPHEVLIVALREQPALLDLLVAKLTGKRLPRVAKPADATLRFVKPAELKLDLLFRSGRRWTLVEVQRSIDPRKRRTWLLAASLLFHQTRVLGDVLVITPHAAVARWAARVAHARTPGGTRLSLEPIVLHLDGNRVDALLDERHPGLALCAAWAVQHRHGPHAKHVVERALELTERLPRALREAQERAIMSVLSERMAAWLLEASVDPSKIVLSRKREKILKLVQAAARRRELEEMAIAWEKAEAKVWRESLLKLLRSRKLRPSREELARIEACTDVEKLERWFTRALEATSMREVLRTRSTPPPAPRKAPARPRAARTARA